MYNSEGLPIKLSEEVHCALSEKRQVVALESTVITHGLPKPLNWEVLARLQQVISEEDCTAATIIVHRGVAHIGIDDSLKEELQNTDIPFNKLSLRDLPLAFARKDSGGTTVSATMGLAHRAGIEVFATGGIGGVHRFWQDSWDVSMDLIALSRMPVIVVSAGCKAILDVEATLEMLESFGVPVVGWQTDTFPLFYTPESNYHISRCDDLDLLAQSWKAHKILRDNGSGMLVANPIPKEYGIHSSQIEPFINQAIAEAKHVGIKGKELTPFLLDLLAQITKGESVKANIALLEHNARLASGLAKAL